MPGVARIGDEVQGICRNPSHPVRNFIGHWDTLYPSGSDLNVVKANNISVIRLNDRGTTDCGHVFYASTASNIGGTNGRGLHRIGDEVIVIGGGEGVTTTGSGTITCA